MGDSKMHADRLREMAEWDQPGWKTSLLAGAEALETNSDLRNQIEQERLAHQARLQSLLDAIKEAKTVLGDIASVGNSYCNEHDDVDCITCIHETCIEALAKLEAIHE